MRLIDRSLTLTSCRVIYSNSQTSTSFSADGFIVFLLKIKLNRISSYLHLTNSLIAIVFIFYLKNDTHP